MECDNMVKKVTITICDMNRALTHTHNSAEVTQVTYFHLQNKNL